MNNDWNTPETQLFAEHAAAIQRITQLERKVEDLERELRRLQRKTGDFDYTPSSTIARLRHTIVPENNLAPMRPVEELTDEAAALDESLTMDQIGQHLNKRRVRPEDIQLTPADLERINHRHYEGNFTNPLKPSDIVKLIALLALVAVFLYIMVQM